MKRRSHFFSLHLAGLLLAMFVLMFSQSSLRAFADTTPCSSAMSQLDCASLYGNWTNWVPDDGSSSSCAGTGDTTLVGSDNAEKTWNFFKAKGLDDTHVAAIMGNLQQESGFNPEVLQIGGTSKDPNAAGAGGYGLGQWTPGSKVIGIAKNLNITTPIYELSTQLNIIWAEMNGTTPTGATNFLKPFQQTTALADAVQYFVLNFEGPSVVGPRLTFAQDALKRYGNSTSPGQVSSSGGGCTSLSPDCVSASGVAKILCAAKKYDTVSYFEGLEGGHQGAALWHKTCPSIGPSCVLDCSGLVNIAIYDVFGTDVNENTDGERADIGKYWKSIPLSQVQPGDIMQPNTGHVEIIDHVKGSTLFTFAAHTDSVPQPQQVGPAQYTADSGMLYLHYIGPGV